MEAVRRPAVRAAVLLLSLFAAQSMTAQAPDETASRVRALEEKLDALEQQSKELRSELESLKSVSGVLEPEATTAEDLTAIEPLGEAAPEPAPALDAPVVAAVPSASSRNIFNPEISMIGNFLGHAGDENPFDGRDSLAFDEAELALQAFVDPYAKALFFVGIGEEGAELEEGYAHFLHLPFESTAKAGKLKATFGKFNTTHAHVWQQIDQPLVMRSFFGDEGLADSGVSLSKLFPNRWDLFVEGTAEVYRGSVEDVFEREDSTDLLYVGHLKIYKDLTDDSNLEFGGSYASGPIGDAGRSSFSGIDLTYRWKPLERSIYRSFISRTELIMNDRDDQRDEAFGFYTSADYQFARRWLAGIRLDQADRTDDPLLTDRGGAFTLTFRPSEFSQIRGQLRRIRYDEGPEANEVLLQIQFAIGAHGAHTF